MEEVKEVKEVKKTYTEAQKRATKKYRENNKEKVNEQRKKYYQNRKAKDPTFLEYKRNKAKEYYTKKKLIKKKVEEKIEEKRLKSKDAEEIIKIIEKVKQSIYDTLKEKNITKIEEHLQIDKTVQEKKKRKNVKKNKTI